MFLEIDKISLKEAFNNDNGRTSANKIIGVITSFICMILVVSLTIFYFFHTGEAGTVLALIDKTIMYFGCAAGLMGVKSVSSAIWRKNVPTYTPPNLNAPGTGQYPGQYPNQYPQQYPTQYPEQYPNQNQYPMQQPIQPAEDNPEEGATEAC